MRRIVALSVLVLLAYSAPVAAQDDFFSEFHFKKLQFKFWPSGVDNRQKSDGAGSAITVHVDEVRIEGINAQELRHCIDGDPSFCSYQIPGGNADGTVTSDEVQSFENISIAAIKSAVPRVGKMATMLQKNVSVDGMAGKNAVITRVQFKGAEGKTSSEALVLAYIDAKVTYENDPKAKSHTIKVDDLPLKEEFFIYDNALWVSGNDRWSFDREATSPGEAKNLVNSQGYFSTQDRFEQLSTQGLQIKVQEGGGSKRSPGPEAAAILGTLALLAILIRRRD